VLQGSFFLAGFCKDGIGISLGSVRDWEIRDEMRNCQLFEDVYGPHIWPFVKDLKPVSLYLSLLKS
jgi:hypothetical protein